MSGLRQPSAGTAPTSSAPSTSADSSSNPAAAATVASPRPPKRPRSPDHDHDHADAGPSSSASSSSAPPPSQIAFPASSGLLIPRTRLSLAPSAAGTRLSLTPRLAPSLAASTSESALPSIAENAPSSAAAAPAVPAFNFTASSSTAAAAKPAVSKPAGTTTMTTTAARIAAAAARRSTMSAAIPTSTSTSRSMAPPPPPPAKRSVLANSSKSTVNASRARRHEITKRTGSTSTSFAPPPPAPTASSSRNSTGSEPAMKKTKRAAWDTKGRLEDLELTFKTVQDTMAGYKETAANLADTLKESNKRIRELESFKTSLESTVDAKTQENHGMANELAQLRHELALAQDRHQQQLQRALAAHQAEVMQLKLDRDDLDRRNALLKHELDHANENVVNLRSALSTSTVASTSLEAKVRTLTMQLDDKTAELDSTRAELAVRTARVDELEMAVRAAETERRKLHNTIQELKGNIRVFCRVRPMLPKELEREENRMARMVFAPSGKAVELVEVSKSADGSKTVTKPLPFAFDRVFDPSATQTAVFDEISQLVQSALDGYNVCIFAYGQTGSGKTFTMEGAGPSPTDAALIDVDDAVALNAAAYADDHRGMIPRAVDQIFASAAALKEQGWTYSFKAQYIEIYNETLRDLLAPPNATTTTKYQIQHANGRTIVTDATLVDVTSPAQIHAMLVRAARNRAVATTNMNERSSRSHSVFALAIEGKNETTGESGRGTINLVDLAGSERLNQSGAVGDRLKETQAINKSLSALGDVMVALANRDAHVPYRNSKLTYLLQQSLGGNSKTLMFVNVSPLEKSFNETVNSLRFATKVNACQIGTARKNSSKSG
ncbi:hypothetical protein GGF32_009847 [Allomyces javanicus]|nr:hypothetical protein GGF32_009847 [Allomyces javanicus]